MNNRRKGRTEDEKGQKLCVRIECELRERKEKRGHKGRMVKQTGGKPYNGGRGKGLVGEIKWGEKRYFKNAPPFALVTTQSMNPVKWLIMGLKLSIVQHLTLRRPAPTCCCY